LFSFTLVDLNEFCAVALLHGNFQYAKTTAKH
jgi:hypothetical protein